jgi:phage antirepressor YoqD-like protein
MNELSKEYTTTVEEVARVLGVTPEAIKKHVRELFPEIIKNGVTIRLNEYQVTEIKKRMIPTTQVVAAKTDMEMEELTLNVIQYHVEKYKALKEELKQSENHVKRLIHDTKTYTSTEIAKELNLKSAQELNELLAEKGMQYKVNKTWVLNAKYADQDYTSIKQEELDNGIIIYNRHWTGKGRDFILSFNIR